MLLQEHNLGVSAHHIVVEGNGYSQISQVLQTTLNFHSLTLMGLYWLIMLVAMMSPLLAAPFRYLWVRSLARRRWLAIILFLIAYISIWIIAGIVLMLAALLLQIMAGEKWLVAPGIALVLAVLWQSSPWKQVCLNRCHWQPRLCAFGLAAVRDCLYYGAVKGFWCVGACWALMLFPLTAVHAHLALMAVTALIIIIERYRPARPARWRIPFWEKALVVHLARL
jgi:predicted metal-binding membrane protein